MKVAVVYNRDSKNVINLFGRPNVEKIGLKTIKGILEALKAGGHQAIALEGDKEFIDRLEEFMPKVLTGERPGLVFNVSYGIQGNARYTHVPSILEMIGIPYVGSGPQAHSLALDKVVAKMIWKQRGVPTADFVVFDDNDFPAPNLPYPLIVKPQNEAVSFGVKIVQNETELREAAANIFKKFSQPVLAEIYIDGREINVSLLGNSPPEVLPPAEILFGDEGPRIYTYEDKTGRSKRKIVVDCPANLTPELLAKAQEIARAAFKSLGCADCARVDMRLDKDNNFYVLEINSLPSLGEHGSFTHAAAAAGLDYTALINRLVDVASARYFGTPKPPELSAETLNPEQEVFAYITQNRDRIERRLSEWTEVSSRTNDPVGLAEGRKKFEQSMHQLAMKVSEEFTNDQSAWTWETNRGFDGGTLLIFHLDVPIEAGYMAQSFRRDPEWLYGEGIGTSRAPLVILEYALQAMRHFRQLHKRKVGVLLYTDEGRDARYSGDTIAEACVRAANVLVLRPGGLGDFFVHQRRGQRKYRLIVEGTARRLGQAGRTPDTLLWFCEKIGEISALSDKKNYIALAATNVKSTSYPVLLPHRIEADLLLSFLDSQKAEATIEKVRKILGKKEPSWDLELISNRPSMPDRKCNHSLHDKLLQIAQQRQIPLDKESSLWPSVAGLVGDKTAVVCGMGPVAKNLYTPQECVQRISLIQRTLLLAEFLMSNESKANGVDGTHGEEGRAKTERVEPAART